MYVLPRQGAREGDMSRCFEVLLALQHAALGHVQVVQLLLRWVVPHVSCVCCPVARFPTRQLRHDGENGKPPVHIGPPAN